LRKLSLSEWASFAEIVGAFAVVVSLIFVIMSVDRNTAAITAQVGDSSYEAIRELNVNLLNNPELFDITSRAAANPESLNATELEKYKLWLHINLDLWERFYDWDRSGVIEHNVGGWHDYFSAWTKRHVTKELWDDIKWKFTDPEFHAQVESALSD
jgi:hypothetical protein